MKVLTMVLELISKGNLTVFANYNLLQALLHATC